jgi:transposase
MNVFRTIDQDGRRPVVHVAGRHPVALCPSRSRPSVTTNGTGWRDVIDVVRTLVVTLSICVRRFVCEFEDCPQRSFDERFEGIGRGGASYRALGFFADLQRRRATRRVAIDLGVPQHYLRIAVAKRRRAAFCRRHGRLGAHLAIDECSVRRNFVYATVFSDPEAGVVIDLAPGRDASAVMFFAHLYSHAERSRVRVVTIDCHAPYRMAVRGCSRTPSSSPMPSTCAAVSATHSPRCAGRPGTPGGTARREWAGSSSRCALPSCDRETSSRQTRAGVESANECLSSTPRTSIVPFVSPIS